MDRFRTDCRCDRQSHLSGNSRWWFSGNNRLRNCGCPSGRLSRSSLAGDERGSFLRSNNSTQHSFCSRRCDRGTFPLGIVNSACCIINIATSEPIDFQGIQKPGFFKKPGLSFVCRPRQPTHTKSALKTPIGLGG